MEQSSIDNTEMSESAVRSGSKRLESILRYSEAKRKSTVSKASAASTKRESVHITSEAAVCEIAPSETSAATAASGAGTVADVSIGDATVNSSVEPVKSEVLLAPSEYRESMRCLH